MSKSEAVESSMNVLATVLLAIRDRIFFCALRPMSRALKVSWVSVMTGVWGRENESQLRITSQGNRHVNGPREDRLE